MEKYQPNNLHSSPFASWRSAECDLALEKKVLIRSAKTRHKRAVIDKAKDTQAVLKMVIYTRVT